jgi:hypothetical protein
VPVDAADDRSRKKAREVDVIVMEPCWFQT